MTPEKAMIKLTADWHAVAAISFWIRPRSWPKKGLVPLNFHGSEPAIVMHVFEGRVHLSGGQGETWRGGQASKDVMELDSSSHIALNYFSDQGLVNCSVNGGKEGHVQVFDGGAQTMAKLALSQGDFEMDDFALFSRPLTAKERLAIYEAGLRAESHANLVIDGKH